MAAHLPSAELLVSLVFFVGFVGVVAELVVKDPHGLLLMLRNVERFARAPGSAARRSFAWRSDRAADLVFAPAPKI